MFEDAFKDHMTCVNENKIIRRLYKFAIVNILKYAFIEEWSSNGVKGFQEQIPNSVVNNTIIFTPEKPVVLNNNDINIWFR